MRELLNSLKAEVTRHRDRMAEMAQQTFLLDGWWVRIIINSDPTWVSSERHTATAQVGCCILPPGDAYACSRAGAAKLAAAIVTKCDVQWMDHGPELLSLINIAMRTP